MLKKNLPWLVMIFVAIALVGMMMGSTTKHAIVKLDIVTLYHKLMLDESMMLPFQEPVFLVTIWTIENLLLKIGRAHV